MDGQVVMYADRMTGLHAAGHIGRRGAAEPLQEAHNAAHGIDPATVRKSVTDILALIRPERAGAPVPEGSGDLTAARRRAAATREQESDGLPDEELERLIHALDQEMREAAADLRFEYAARLRDEIKELRSELREIRG